MIKTITRSLYIDGKFVEEYTQDADAWSELADLEQIAARVELQEKAQRGTNVCNDTGNPSRSFRKRRPKMVQFKLKLLQAVSKMLLLGREPSVQRHVMCLYVEHDMEIASHVPSDTAQT